MLVRADRGAYLFNPGSVISDEQLGVVYLCLTTIYFRTSIYCFPDEQLRVVYLCLTTVYLRTIFCFPDI